MARQQQFAMIRQQQQQQQHAQQQNGGVPINFPNGGNPPMTPAQFAAMQQAGSVPGNVPGVNLPSHIQLQQMQAQASATQHQQQQQAQQQQQQQQQQQHQQQQQAHHQQQQQQQQQAMQQLAHQQAVPILQGQAVPPPMRPQSQQMQGIQEAHAAAAAQHQQQQRAQQHQAQQQAVHQQQQAQQQHQAQQQAAAAAAIMQPRVPNPLRGASVLKLLQFGDHLSQFSVNAGLHQYGRPDGASQSQARRQSNDLNYWQLFADRFFSPSGVLRQQVYDSDIGELKQFEISTPLLPRYYWTHFSSGVQNMQMVLENAREKDLPNGGHFVESAKLCFIYWFVNGCQVNIPLLCIP